MRYYIGCRVSGGVTGTRESVVKAHGLTIYFANRADAEAEATRLRDTMGRNSAASFHYWVEEDADYVDPTLCPDDEEDL